MALGLSPGAMGGKIGSERFKLASPPPGVPRNLNRAERRQKQQRELDAFKSKLKPVEGTGGTLLQEEAPMFNPNTGRYERTTLAQKQIDLANKYGPTIPELLRDIGGGIGDILGKSFDFTTKGGVIGNVLSDLYGKVKGGAQQGVETVSNLYDGLRNAFKGESQFVVPKTGGTIFEGKPIETGPQFPYNFETIMKPRPDPLQPSEMSQEQFMESFPELYSGNPLFRQRNFEPVKVSDMDMSGVMASNMGQNIIGNLQNLQNLAQQYNLNKIQFDPFNPNRIGYKDQFMFNDTPVNYNIGIGDQGLQGGIQFAFKKGGSVDKHGGLGYKLK